MTLVAEGVETEDQRRFLVAQGCDRMQGYHLGRPMPAAEFLDRLRPEERAFADAQMRRALAPLATATGVPAASHRAPQHTTGDLTRARPKIDQEADGTEDRGHCWVT